MSANVPNGLMGKRGRKPAVLPDYAETNADGKLRCTLCVLYAKHDYRGQWVLPSSFKSHSTRPSHIKATQIQQEQATAAAAAAQSQVPQSFTMFREIDINPSSSREDRELDIQQDAEREMWENFDGDFELDPGPSECDSQNRKDFERRLEEYGWWDGPEPLPLQEEIDLNDLWDEAEQDEMLSKLLERTTLEGNESDESDEDIIESATDKTDAWSPYPSKIAFLLDTIDNLPRFRISSSMMKVVLWLLKEVGVRKVPSFDALRKIQKKIKAELVVPTIPWMSPRGNAFSFNDPRTIVANDWANPLVAKHIRRYPVIPRNGVISEVWHAKKWHEDLDRHLLSPMYEGGNGRHYFIDEPARLDDGRVIIPVRWLEDEDGVVWFDAWEVERNNETGLSKICDEKQVRFLSSKLKENMLDLEGLASMPNWCQDTVAKGHPTRMPNPDRALAEGHPIYTSFIDVFRDDVSGNRSKSWNKHWNIYITHRNLPRQMLNHQSHIHFISTSTHATGPEQFQAIKDIIEKTHQSPIRTKSAIDGRETRLKLGCNCGPGDNPAQSETCGHIGSQGNYPCRKCKIGGSQKEKETDNGFHTFFAPGEPRSSVEILDEVKKQVSTACLGVAQTVKDLQTNSGIKDGYTQPWIDELIERSRALHRAQPQRPPEDIQAELMKWVEENEATVFNPFLTLRGFDVAQDTPVEILHTILLGIVKYVWYGSHSSWTDSHKKLYSNRLQATNTIGLSIPAIRANYIMQYANSLIGRQLKTLTQVNVFHVYDIVDSLQFLLTKAVGELSALLWFPEIHNLDEYLNDVEIAAANVLDIAALIDPSKIVLKIKYHLLAHLREDILRFGPLVGVASETYECFNAIFRFCSILSNHLAPSRDIALQLAEQETVKHFLSGGYWKSASGEWKQPAPLLTQYLKKHPFLQTLLGYGQSATAQLPAGFVRLEPIKRVNNKKVPRTTSSLSDTLAFHAVNVADVISNTGLKWYRGKYTVSQSGDECIVGSWVFATSPLTPTGLPYITGRITEILQDIEGRISVVALDVFQVCESRDEFFGMPVLIRRADEPMTILVPAKTLLFHYNVQHACCEAKCTASGKRRVVQERSESGLTESFIEHKPLEKFLINTAALHNAHLIRKVLSRDVTRPIPFSQNRIADHSKIAAKLRESQDAKRLKTAEKKKATLEKKKLTEVAGNSQAKGRAAGSSGNKRKRADTATDTVEPGVASGSQSGAQLAG